MRSTAACCAPVRSLARRPQPEPGARDAALAILDQVESGHAPAAALLARIPSRMAARDRALATTLVNGVLRRRSDLDRLIARVSSRPPADIDPPVLEALRLALYQILFLDRIPASAARFASLSQRSLKGCPSWPRTHSQVT